MKIAIMTWFHYANYGTALQVTALSRVLESYGHSVKVIQYYPSEITNFLPSMPLFKELSTKVVKKIKNKYNIVENISGKYFIKYREKQLNLTDKCETLSDLEALNGEFDVFICGSDQIWSPLCFNAHYFLDFVKDVNQMIAYAPSVGTFEIEDKFIEKQMVKLTKRFQYISIREKNGAELISKLIEKEVKNVIDPTLLLSEDEWNKNLEINKKKNKSYLLAYFLGNNESHWKTTYKLAKKLDLSVKVIPVFEEDLRRKGVISNGVGPREFVEYVENADYICTDSFHGVAFSINFSKDFCCFERFKNKDRENQNSRIYNILNHLNLENRLYKKENLEHLIKKINYLPVIKKLEILRKESQSFLISSLEQVQEYNLKSSINKNHVFKYNTMCCGCGVCANVCHKNAINIEMTEDGFWEAKVDASICVSCGKCKEVCPFQNNSGRISIKEGRLYSYKDKDSNLLLKSSSGGIAYRLADLLQNKGYSIVGCTFDREEQKAKHILISPKDKEGLCKLQGSKYMQSDFSSVLEEIVNCKTPIAIFGTPCEIAGVRNILKNRKDIFYIDLICHGVPSYHLYKKYKKSLKIHYGMNTDKMEIVFRYKPKGWRDRYIYSANLDKEIVVHQSKDEYFLMFEQGACYSSACYECRWRSTCSADLRIGDYWGNRFKKDLTGVSMILSMTEQGKILLNEVVKSEFRQGLKKQNLEDYYNSQQTEIILKPVYYDEIIELLKDDKYELTDIVKKYALPFEKRKQVMRKIHEIYDKIKRKK